MSNDAWEGPLILESLLDLRAPTAGQIAFPPGGNASSDPNILDFYERGSWSPTDQSGAGLTLNIAHAQYVRIGNLVIAQCVVVYPTTTNVAASKIGPLPYACASAADNAGILSSSAAITVGKASLAGGSSNVTFTLPNGAPLTNAMMSGTGNNFTLVYFAA